MLLAVLPYLHDIVPPGYKYPGFSDLRVFLFVLFNYMFGLAGWLLAFKLAKGKQWRFVLSLPILSTTYQIIINILNLKSTALNEFNVKFVIIFSLFGFLVLWYFKKKQSNV